MILGNIMVPQYSRGHLIDFWGKKKKETLKGCENEVLVWLQKLGNPKLNCGRVAFVFLLLVNK